MKKDIEKLADIFEKQKTILQEALICNLELTSAALEIIKNLLKEPQTPPPIRKQPSPNDIKSL